MEIEVQPSEESRQSIIDSEHLKILSLGYYISAGVCAFFSLFGAMYMFMGVMFITSFKNMPSNGPNSALPAEFGWIFFGMGAFMFLLMIAMASMKFMVARRIQRRTSRTFCMVIAGISCLEIPYGTALGVLSLVVFNRESVINLFSANQPS